MLESTLQKQLKKELEKYEDDLDLMRQNTGACEIREGVWISFGVLGGADFIGLDFRARFVAVETKGETQSKENRIRQLNYRRRIEKKGGIYIKGKSVSNIINQLKKKGCIRKVHQYLFDEG